MKKFFQKKPGKEIIAQNRPNIGVTLGHLFMSMDLKDLLKEEIVLKKISVLDDISINKYIQTTINENRFARDALQEPDTVNENINDILQDLKKEPDIKIIQKLCFYEKLCDVFILFFIRQKHLKIDFSKKDEEGFYTFFPTNLKTFIKDSYSIFEKIIDTDESIDLIDLLDADTKTRDLSFLNRVQILTLIFLGQIQSGKNITRMLFKSIPKQINVPGSFKRLCRIKNGKYKIINTDFSSIDFKLAVFDLIQFVDRNNKTLFKNKVNQYLKNC